MAIEALRGLGGGEHERCDFWEVDFPTHTHTAQCSTYCTGKCYLQPGFSLRACVVHPQRTLRPPHSSIMLQDKHEREETMEDIRKELLAPFEDPRELYCKMTDEDLFCAMTGETDKTLCRGTVVMTKFSRRTEGGSYLVRLDNGLTGRLMDKCAPSPAHLARSTCSAVTALQETHHSTARRAMPTAMSKAF